MKWFRAKWFVTFLWKYEFNYWGIGISVLMFNRHGRASNTLHFHYTFMTTSSNGNIVRITGHRLPVDSPHKGQCRGASMFSLICAWTNDWAKTRDAGHLTRHRAYYDVTVICDCDNSFLSNTLQLWHLLSVLFAITWYSFLSRWNIFGYYSINYHFPFTNHVSTICWDSGGNVTIFRLRRHAVIAF